MKTIDYPEALELVTKAIEQRGADHVGSECSYARSTNPGEYEPCCLVGTALHIAGVHPDVLHKMDFAGDCGKIALPETISVLENLAEVTLTP